jgi:hypothetical protein
MGLLLNNKKVCGDTITPHALFRGLSVALNQRTDLKQKIAVTGFEGVDDYNSLNGIQQTNYNHFEEMKASLHATLADMVDGAHKVEKLFSSESITAAALALATANGGYVPDSKLVPKRQASGEGNYYVNSEFSATEKFEDIFGKERFDDNVVAKYRVTSVGIQLANMNQREYISLAFPTVLVGPTDGETGFTLKFPRGTIQDRSHVRDSGAAPVDIRKTSLLSKYRNVGGSVDHQNLMHPVVRPEFAKYIASYGHKNVINYLGNTEATAPLKVGESCDYIQLCKPTGYVEYGPAEGTPSVAPGGYLQRIYLANKGDLTDIVMFDVEGRNGSRFVFNQTNGLDSNSQQMNFEATIVLDETNVKGLDGVTDSPYFSALVKRGYKVHLVIQLNATLLLENGTIATSSPRPRIDKVYDASGAELARDSWTTAQKEFESANGKAVIDSVDFDLRKYNSNLEIFGDIVHVDTVNMHFETTVNSPVSILSPNNGTSDSPEILNMLSQAVFLRCHQMATVELVKARGRIKDAARGASTDPVRVQGSLAGALCYIPAYEEDAFSIEDGLNCEKSGELLNDISGSLRAKIKDMVAKLMRDSLYVQAVQSSYIIAEKQKGVKIGIITSQYIAPFLQVQGDTRILGDEYEVEIHVNPDEYFDDKIYIFPTTMDNGKTEPNPLQFGLGIYQPDAVYHATATYGGKTITEVRVMNRWVPYTLGAVLGVLEVSGITSVVTNRVRKTIDQFPAPTPAPQPIPAP